MKLVKDTNTENEIKKVSDKEAEEAFKTILSWGIANVQKGKQTSRICNLKL